MLRRKFSKCYFLTGITSIFILSIILLNTNFGKDNGYKQNYPKLDANDEIDNAKVRILRNQHWVESFEDVTNTFNEKFKFEDGKETIFTSYT